MADLEVMKCRVSKREHRNLAGKSIRENKHKQINNDPEQAFDAIQTEPL